MTFYKFDRDKAISTVLFILNKLGECDFHKLFKILYFAEQKHIVRYGRPILGESYIVMRAGPVPSIIYDFLKYVRGDGFFGKEDLKEDLKDFFEVKNNCYVSARKDADIDELSETDIDCLIESIDENAPLSFKELVNKSHDSAWRKSLYEISFIDIAKAGGADSEILDYINTDIENKSALMYGSC